ncbi:anti-sigma factor [Loktanella sp. M215]|uniref:anti-sigma factor n=1 Tax=Loktanella sp. M215 TaxID=2675431 RepID=UPI001F027349|nr:anti-sigma factor [Loktanella sp. M215]MCF7701245.1 anti-sigma factor [Loktanella sp. M215]
MTRLSDEIIALSDDYVLGLLTPAEAELMEAIIARDTALAQRVGALRDQLLPLDLSADPVTLPDGFTAKVLRKLPTQDLEEAPSSGAAAVVAANAPGAPGRRALGLIAAVVAGLALGIGFTGMRPLPAPTVVAVLVDADGVPQAVIDDYGNDTATVRFVADIAVPADRTLQVWTLPSQDMGPTSLGTLDRTAPTLLNFTDLPDPGAQQLYEVTLEPLGGSPTGRPTGPIIGKGFAAPQV